MDDNRQSLSKGSQSLFGKGELLGKIKQSKKHNRIVKSEQKKDQ